MQDADKNQDEVERSAPAANLSEDEGVGVPADSCSDKPITRFMAILAFGPSKEE